MAETKGNKERILNEINKKKEILVQIASHLKITDHRVVKCSQELDELINQLYITDNFNTIPSFITKNSLKRGV